MRDGKRCMLFLQANGWEIVEKTEGGLLKGGTTHFIHSGGGVGVDLLPEEIVLLDGSGDFAHIPVARVGYYQLIGLLLTYRQITAAYTEIPPNYTINQARVEIPRDLLKRCEQILSTANGNIGVTRERLVTVRMTIARQLLETTLRDIQKELHNE